MSETKNPKIFISYSWSSDNITMPLAERLISHGVDVVLDKWDLKEGQDKYAFMEKSVNDPNICKVLIICDKVYTEKANNRQGGVGDETAIISPEIYGKTDQEKFIPIIVEKDESGDPFVPAYIKSRIYIDLSDLDKYEDEYEKLIRNIYGKPIYKKPTLGNKPEWLEEEKTNLFPLKDLIRQIKGASSVQKQTILIQRFGIKHIEILKTYYDKGIKSGRQVFEVWGEIKPVRDCFLDWLEALSEIECDLGNLLCNTFEKLYNTLTCVKTFDENANSYSGIEFEVYKIYIWELFICTTTFLRYYEKYDVLNAVLGNTYFLINDGFGSESSPRHYYRFQHYSRFIDGEYCREIGSNMFTLMGNTLCCDRERMPIYTKLNLALADLFLYQVCYGFHFSDGSEYLNFWFPRCYVYCEYGSNGWEKLISKRYCMNICKLFGVSSIEELKESISTCVHNNEASYSSSWLSAPAILDSIKIEDIATMR